MCPAWWTGHAPASDHLWINTCVPSHHDLMHEQWLLGVRSLLRARVRSTRLLCQCLARISNASGIDIGCVWSHQEYCHLSQIPNASGHPVTNAFNSFSLPTSSPLQMCQHHQVYTIMCKCVSISQTFSPKELATRLATPLNPSNDAKLHHSSGTRWPICKQVCPSW
jgi:hypothetical protein